MSSVKDDLISKLEKLEKSVNDSNMSAEDDYYLREFMSALKFVIEREDSIEMRTYSKLADDYIKKDDWGMTYFN